MQLLTHISGILSVRDMFKGIVLPSEKYPAPVTAPSKETVTHITPILVFVQIKQMRYKVLISEL